MNGFKLGRGIVTLMVTSSFVNMAYAGQCEAKQSQCEVAAEAAGLAIPFGVFCKNFKENTGITLPRCGNIIRAYDAAVDAKFTECMQGDTCTRDDAEDEEEDGGGNYEEDDNDDYYYEEEDDEDDGGSWWTGISDPGDDDWEDDEEREL